MPVFMILFLFFNYIYEDADSLLVINDSLVICGYHQYNLKVHIANNAKLKVREWNGIDSTGRIILQAPFIYLHGSMIDGSGKGYSGGTNTHPNGYGPGCGTAGVGGGGGGGGYGGMGGDGGDLDPGAGGISYGNAYDTIISMGSGGGAGRLSQVDGFGGNGGALIYLKGEKILIDTAQILSEGMRGYDGGYEAGGGGAGGGIKIQGDTLRIRYTAIRARGGDGGSAAGGGGGGGGGGRIKIFFAVLDTSQINLAVDGGLGGYGGYGFGEDGFPGTIHFGPIVMVKEKVCSDLPTKRHYLIANGRLTFFAMNKPDRIMVYNAMGKLVKYQKVIEDEFDMTDFAQGIYFLKFADECGLIKLVLIK
ncbi:MAG: T9SS type A sorting domain-containing protein [candidate division WOR-3 bacterium]